MKHMKVKIIMGILMVALFAYGISAASPTRPAITSGDDLGAISSIGSFGGGMDVSSASSNGLGVGGVSGHAGVLSLWRFNNLGTLLAIVEPAIVKQAVFAMNDGTGKTILILTRSYTDSVWDSDPIINQFRYEALMKITAIDPTDGTILWDKTVTTDTYTDD